MASVTEHHKHSPVPAVFGQDCSWSMVALAVRCHFVPLPHTSQIPFQTKVFSPPPSPHHKYTRKNKQTNNNRPTLDINPFGFLINSNVALSFTIHCSPQALSKSFWQSSALEPSSWSTLGEVTVSWAGELLCMWRVDKTRSEPVPSTLQHGLSVDILFCFIAGITSVVVIVEMVPSSCQYQHLSLRSSLCGSAEL